MSLISSLHEVILKDVHSLSFYFSITNLKYWGRSEQIISKTLQLLNDLSVGYSCVRKLVKLDEVQFMLNNHTSEHFPFLGNSVAITEMRCRSMFYTSLGRLLMVDLGEDEDRFHTFMLPLTGDSKLSNWILRLIGIIHAILQ